jgi:phosphohistidine swiveling domain-containing protein
MPTTGAAVHTPAGDSERTMVAVYDLREPEALDSDIVGAKAANLARSVQAGLTVLPGFALTTVAAERGLDDPAVTEGLRAAWTALTAAHPGPVVVRSSSTVEDAEESSMAGQFTSVLDVHDWTSLCDAVTRVLDSAARVAGVHESMPMAVLVQPQLESVVGGVMFGVDPVDGNRHHVVVDAVGSRVDDLVSGRVSAAHYVLSPHGRVLSVTHPDFAPALERDQRRALVRLAHAAAHAFGRPQDIEWAIDGERRLWLLQSRPVTAVRSPETSVVLGPGPIAETFPAPLSALEIDLWIPPLREGITRALTAARAVSRRHLAASPVLTTVGGYAAVDLELLGMTHPHRSRWRLLDPRPGARRLAAAWRVGRLRVALPTLTADVVAAVDRHLSTVAPLASLGERDLLRMLDDARRELATVHSLEILTGMLAADRGVRTPMQLVALGSLREGRAAGLTDQEIMERHPEVLALVPPALLGPVQLPDVIADVTAGGIETSDGIEHLGDRDALRLRTRWLQELLARVARELAGRLVDRGALASSAAASDCTIEELAAMAGGSSPPTDLGARASKRPGPPLPATFRLTARGDIVPRRTGAEYEGVPAGGGRGEGIVRATATGHADARDTVLVVSHLEPQLASVLPALAGLVAETGSALSHLAILARELRVPTVVAVPDACRRFPPGTRLVVDGTSGEVSILAEKSS